MFDCCNDFLFLDIFDGFFGIYSLEDRISIEIFLVVIVFGFVVYWFYCWCQLNVDVFVVCFFVDGNSVFVYEFFVEGSVNSDIIWEYSDIVGLVYFVCGVVEVQLGEFNLEC